MELNVTAQRNGPLSSFLKGELKMSAGLINKLKWGDAIRVNGEPRRTNYAVVPGDIITVALDEEEPAYPAEAGDLTVLYEDDHILVVDKPAGMLIHPSRAKNSGTLANFVVGYYQKTGQKCAFHPVTRLDRDTFGVTLLAKNAYVHSAFQETDLQKTYHALTFGGPKEDAGIIDAPIARKPLPSLLREVRVDGKPSVTSFQVLAREKKICKLRLSPITGRTHQLRVHCAYAGCPILGDPQYGTAESQAFSREWNIPHQLLCAKELTFTHPMTGKRMTITSRMEASI